MQICKVAYTGAETVDDGCRSDVQFQADNLKAFLQHASQDGSKMSPGTISPQHEDADNRPWTAQRCVEY